MTLPDFIAQCCDATGYLELGKICALGNSCYDETRPMGAILWFGLPYRLGVSQNAIILVHVALLLASSCLSFFSTQKLIRLVHPLHNRGMQIIMGFACLVAHIVFLYPVIHTSLSDVPASLFALIAVWLLILNPQKSLLRILFLASAGLFLGLAAWIRAFFLYPVLVAVTAWFLFWLFNQERKYTDIVFLILFIPLAIQVIETKNQTGVFSYIDPKDSQHWSDIHLNSLAAGYDTILPNRPWFWKTQCEAPIIESLKTANISSLGCLLAARLNFYWGSYSPTGYFPGDATVVYDNLNFSQASLLSGMDGKWKNSNMAQRRHIESIKGEKRSVVQISKPDINSYGEMYQTFYFQKNSHCAASMELWSPRAPQIVTLTLRNHTTKELLSERRYVLASITSPPLYILPHPKTAIVDADINESGFYDVVIASKFYDKKSEEAQEAARHNTKISFLPFYVWEDRMWDTVFTEGAEAARIFSKSILLLNSMAFVGSLLLLVKLRNQLNLHMSITLIFLSTSFAEALLIIPEQRFVITPMIAIWVFFFTWVTIAVSEQMAKWGNKA